MHIFSQKNPLDELPIASWVGWAVAALFILILLRNTFYIVRTSEAAIIERLGKFNRVAHAGFNIKIPFIDTIRSRISLQVQQLNVDVETKTKDNVFVRIPVAVQYQVVQGRERESFYSLAHHQQQIVAYVQDNVRSSVANMPLDDSFSSKDTIAANVAMSLRDNMAEYGWNFVNTLVTDIRPDERVRTSMNSINAAQREREAAIAQAEAEKIRVVKEAEGAAEAKKLHGRGVADQRKEIAEGLATQFRMLREVGVQQSPEMLMLMTQYLDTMTDVASRSRASVMFMPSNPGGMNELIEGMRNTILSADLLDASKNASGAQHRGGVQRDDLN
ncbi:MAG: SPFH domain-containing protein [Microbacteriaceae bacterium]|nr:SPFH domain-containing protein [Microbacteriaceae bacterium]